MAFFSAFAYPLHRNNLWVMTAGVAAFILPQVVAWLFPLSALVAASLQVLLVLYFALFFQGILEASMAGKVEFPAWPEQSGGSSLLEGVLSFLGPYVVSFLPLIALRCLYADFGMLGSRGFGLIQIFMSGPIPYAVPQAPAWFEPVSWMLAGIGLLYLPMALLVWSFFGGNAVLNPWNALRFILRAGGSYALLVGLIVALLFGWWLAVGWLAALSIPWLQSILTFFSLFYVLCVAMRMIGLHYFENRQRLLWEAAR